ncbi:MAG: protein kinase, partial [Pyrinomonadaceae bacterium]
MTPERWQRVELLLQAALAREPAQRASLLERECAGDVALREEVESLLASAQHADQFLTKSAVEDAAVLLDDEESGEMPGRQIGAYHIHEKLGSGGTGEVYLAHDIKLGRKVALKFLDVGFIDDSASRIRFLREARLASSLDHPNICTIHEVGEAEGRPFIAMQFVDGETLREVIGGKPLALDSLLSIILQIAEALAAAHAQGIIHRDIKAGNIIVTPQGQATVLDFGLAKMLETEEDEAKTHLTVTGAIMGTPASMSPEQARGDRADHRSDIFSFGGVMYEMATGHIPFKGKSRADVISSLLKDPHIPAVKVNKEIPPRLSAVIDRALAKDPADRYQSMRELIADLRQVLTEAGGLDHLFSSSSVPQGVVPFVPLRQRKSFRAFGHAISTRLAFALLAMAAVAIVGLAVATYRYRSRPPLPGAQSKAESVAPFRSIAVLPFKPLVAGSRDEALEMGMADTLINKLSGMKEVIVRPINAVRKYADLEQDAVAAGREQRVDIVLDGSIQKSADKIRVTVRLIKVADGNQLWTESFDEKFTDIFAVQDRVSEKVVGLLAVKLTGQEQSLLAKRYTDDAEAYALYLKGRYHLNRLTDDGFVKGRDYFQQAINKDPNYGLAYAGLADAFNRLSGFNALSPREGFPKARAAAIKALELDDKLAEAHTVLGAVNFFYDWDWPNAEREFKLAVEINQSYADAHQMYSYYLTAMGRFDTALSEMRRAQELDPLSLEKISGVGEILYYQRQYDLAIAQHRKALEMDLNSGFAHWAIGRAYTEKGMYEQAIASFQKAIPLSGDSPDEPASLAYAYALSGRQREARQLIAELESRSKRSYISPVIIAFVYAGLEDKDQAFACLDKAFDERDGIFVFLKVEPAFDRLRSDNRFAGLLER